jgi:putative SOS response-associated peptidase YedK
LPSPLIATAVTAPSWPSKVAFCRPALEGPGEGVAEAFDLSEVSDLSPRFNIAPSQPVAVVRQQAGADARELAFLRWGLIPIAQP